MKVRCWKFYVPSAPDGVVFASYPTGNWGRTLYICAACGYIYAVNVELEVYLGPSVDELVAKKRCSKCQILLSESMFPYPEHFVAIDGTLKKWERPREIPLAEDSVILEFEDLYKDVKR